MKKLHINLKSGNYDIYIEENILAKVNEFIHMVYSNEKIYIITDDIVEQLYLEKVKLALGKEYKLDYVVIPHGEESKNIKVYAQVCETLINKGIKRNHLLIALGGGVVGDLCGFVAATLYRGLPYIGIPTTLLSQMDSSIGGKTGIDFAEKKNILGAFKQPLMVLIDPMTLKTLDQREFNNGMGELIKHGAIGNKKLLEELVSKPEIDENIIFESLSVKKKIVELDEFDQKERMMLNFGHTFGHIIELEYGYKHGEAVGIGMLMATKMGIDLKLVDEDVYEQLEKILKLYSLPCEIYDYHKYLDEIFYDKKNIAGTLNFIFVPKIGQCEIQQFSNKELKERIL